MVSIAFGTGGAVILNRLTSSAKIAAASTGRCADARLGVVTAAERQSSTAL
ncbi:hypothetical protein Y013_22305 [Rhodococcus pyridinivorans SB3094]|uniref:Uncharacterized protein n=1 Tax=Rhodococcus pyridinivorans SB3094 TaxID=1435356 RepID=V9XKD5_9NOCA|nr:MULTISPECIES: hypothetical protein [Rhodococcus]AHD23931.1 hypothetical protein Y013_22305 [Rhodococcus pyridinivorans SB3094]MCT7291724.1 hypothetical protein [Rhodococcus sp. PAE-6]